VLGQKKYRGGRQTPPPCLFRVKLERGRVETPLLAPPIMIGVKKCTSKYVKLLHVNFNMKLQ